MANDSFSHSRKWQGKLDTCIRCGYCYEHCPLYKNTRWETDAPRSKLVVLHGLLQGDLKPTPEVAERLFECFHCKRCEANCSAGISHLEILGDARADLRALGFEPEGTTSQTNRDKCARCLACLRLCAHEARSYDPVTKLIVTDPLACQGCGACLDLCPAAAASIQKGFGTNTKELTAQMTSFLQGASNGDAEAVVFCCSWSSYPGLQQSRYDAEGLGPVRILVPSCSGRIHAHLILDALTMGAWGVLIAACPEGECEHHGNRIIQKRVTRLQETLTQLGMDPSRVQMKEVSKGAPGKVISIVKDFMTHIRTLGPV